MSGLSFGDDLELGHIGSMTNSHKVYKSLFTIARILRVRIHLRPGKST